MTVYRRPIPADLGQLMRLAEEMHAETSFRSLSFSAPKAATEIMSCVMNPNMFVCVAEKDGRGTMAGPRLLKYLGEWAKLCKAKAVFVTLGSDVNQDRVGGLVERLGYARLGGYYRKDVDH